MTEHHKIDFCELGEGKLWALLLLSAEPSKDEGSFHWVNWTLYEQCSLGDHPCFQKKGSHHSPNPVDLGPDPSPELLMESAEIIARGHFKWDGCAEIHDLGIHTCSRRQWEGLVEILQKLPGLCQERFAVPREEEGGW